MSNKFGKFLALSGVERRLFLTAILWSPLFSFGLRIFGIERMLSWIDRVPLDRSKALPQAQLPSIVALTNSAARIAPGSSTCLTRSLLLHWLLRRRGVVSNLRIGVQLMEGRLDAHAWVEVAGMPINDVQDVALRYTPFHEPISPTDFISP